jgi:serpin B
VLLAVFLSQLESQGTPQEQAALFLRANDRFAFDLLKTAHGESPDRNIVVAPLPVSLTFAALRDGGVRDDQSIEELCSAFHWDRSAALQAAGKTILARFQRPKPAASPRSTLPNRPETELERYLRSGKPEEVWLSAAFLYRTAGSLSPEFIRKVTDDFGFPFRAVGEHTPQSEVFAKDWDASLPVPKIIGHNDFWITSFTHLRTSWAGNTIAGGREKRDFQLRAGGVVQADFLGTEDSGYPYARTADFEAVVLTCWKATILLVLPSSNNNIGQLEAAIASKPDVVEGLLAVREGVVCFPPFHFSFEADLRSSIETMGPHRIFRLSGTLSPMVPRMGAVLRGVAQKTEITVDENGIRADAGTIVHGVYGGIHGIQDPFHMTLDRPFLFFVRDRETKALLFEGAVMNPALQ